MFNMIHNRQGILQNESSWDLFTELFHQRQGQDDAGRDQNDQVVSIQVPQAAKRSGGGKKNHSVKLTKTHTGKARQTGTGKLLYYETSHWLEIKICS